MNGNGRGIAAIWCRVSTHDKREVSLDSQETAVRRILEAQGYETPPQYMLKVDWTSLDLMACPDFQKLRRWIAEGEVQAVGVLDRDRLQAQGLQRLIFLSECQDHGVQVITVQGVPMLEGAEGQLVELALALGKERSVMRAQQGAKDGLRDRALLRGLPPTMRKPYGMRWEGNKLVPDEDYPVACDIWRMALEVTRIREIARELNLRGIPTPTGRRSWSPSTIRKILHNRVYAGVLEVLKTEAIIPNERRKNSYGKSSYRLRPVKERVRLEGMVTRPVVTEAEFEFVQRQLLENQRFAARNTGQRHYLLRGLIRCVHCGHVYGTLTRKGRQYYYCRGRWDVPWGAERCSSKSMRAAAIEDAVYGMVMEFLRRPELLLAEVRRRHGITQHSIESMQRELADLKRQDREEQEAEAKAFRYLTHRKVSEDVYEQEVGLIRTRRRWIAEQRQHLERQLTDLERYTLSPESIAALRKRVESRLTNASPQDRRFVLEALGTQVIAHDDGTWELQLEVPKLIANEVQIAVTNPQKGPQESTRTSATKR